MTLTDEAETTRGEFQSALCFSVYLICKSSSFESFSPLQFAIHFVQVCLQLNESLCQETPQMLSYYTWQHNGFLSIFHLQAKSAVPESQQSIIGVYRAFWVFANRIDSSQYGEMSLQNINLELIGMLTITQFVQRLTSRDKTDAVKTTGQTDALSCYSWK